MTGDLEVKASDYTLTVAIDRGDENLFTMAMIDELCDAIRAAENNGLRFVRLRAMGPVFCVGRERKAADVDELRDEAATIVKVNETFQHTSLTVIAEVHGDAAGFGAGLVATADIAIAAEGARFWFPEVLGGLAPTIVISWLSKSVPHKVAFDLVTSGRKIDAHEAQRLGFVTEVVPPDRLDEAVTDRIGELAGMSAGAIREIKQFFTHIRPLDQGAAAEASVEALALSALRARSEAKPASGHD